MDNTEQILDFIGQDVHMRKQDSYADFISALAKTFFEAESDYLEKKSGDEEKFKKSAERMTNLFYIYKILLNQQESKLLESLVSDHLFESTFGVLEYNPEINQEESIGKYRSFLKNEAVYKQVVQFTEIGLDQIDQKIHTCYRLNYLKDTALPTGLEESMIMFINQICQQLSLEIIHEIAMSSEIRTELIAKLHSEDIQVKQDALGFLGEILSFSKSFQAQVRSNILS